MMKKNSNRQANWQMNQQRLKQWNRTQLNILHPQPLENEPPVSQTEAGYQKIRAELHEARKNIPPKTRLMLVNNWQPRAVNMSKTSATRTIRGGFITITAPQIRVKKKKWCRRENNQQQSRRLSPETRTGLSMYQRYSCPLKPDRKTEARTERDGETPKESNQQETAGDTGQEITTDGGSGTTS